jgi:flagellar M-ring protein FliF
MENAPAPTNAIPIPTTPLGAMQTNVSRQSIMKQIVFLLAIAASIAVGGYVLMWSQTPNYQVLFSDLQAKESSEIVAILQQTNVDYKINHSSGAVMVPASKVQMLRMKLAAEGIPRSASQGMEMLNQDQGFGTSQFIERARYQHAMEEELSRSISEIYNVRSARVHLAVPKQSVFVRERKPPSASVVVNLYSGRNLEPGQVAAVTHMVASSVPNLSNKDVTIVDQKGNLLTGSDRDQGLAMSDTQMQYTQKLEQNYIRRIEGILSPIVGLNGVRAQVVAEVDFTMTEQTHESYNPDTVVMRSEQLQEESRTGSAGAALGIPGALSNQPPAAGTTSETTTATEGQNTTNRAATMPGSSSKQSTRNFELDRTISHTRVAPGSVRKLSVAVLIDERRTAGTDETTPLSEAEMTRINALIMDAIGFNQARGDSLNVVNAAFLSVPEQEALPEVPIWEQAWAWDIAKQALGGLLVIFLIFGVIRPAFKDLNKIHIDPEAEAAVQGLLAAQSLGGSDDRIVTGAEDVEAQLNNVRSLVQQDPALVAQVVKNWTASES